MFENDKRIVMTLDAGGTNFVFSAIRGNREIVEPIVKPASSDNLEKCLSTLVEGFSEVKALLRVEPVAISFAFPGPADYKNGIIGDLPNFKSFRGGVALGPFLKKEFDLPVFINNDGNFFAYGEALAGALTSLNERIKTTGGNKTYKNLIGITLGTGFGAGVVIDGVLLAGDNDCGGDAWNLRNKLYPQLIAEESVSIRAVTRVYSELSGEDVNGLTPKDVFDVAEGLRDGNRDAAIESFRQLGEVAGDSLAQMINVVDGIIVIGGGIIGAAKYILPAIVEEMNSRISTFAGDEFPRLQVKVYNLTDEKGFSNFVANDTIKIRVPRSDDFVEYQSDKRIGILVSELGTNKAVGIGAYTYALTELDKTRKI